MVLDCGQSTKLADIMFAIESTWLIAKVSDYFKPIQNSSECRLLFEESSEFTFGWPLHTGYRVYYSLNQMQLGIDPVTKPVLIANLTNITVSLNKNRTLFFLKNIMVPLTVICSALIVFIVWLQYLRKNTKKKAISDLQLILIN